MTPAQFSKAQRLLDEKDDVQKALKAWDVEIKSAAHLGHTQAWNNNHLVEMPAPDVIAGPFDAFRSASINALKVRLAEINKEFADL